MAASLESIIVNTFELPSNGNTPLVVINVSSQLHQKLTPSKFPSWRAQLTLLHIDYNLQGYLNGTDVCPSPTFSTSISFADSSSIGSSNSTFWHWLMKDKLILHAILASVSKMRDSRSVSKYLHVIKVLVYELAMIDSSISVNDIILYVLNGLGFEYRDTAAPIRAHETSLTFEQLHDMLIGHESYLKHVEASNSALVAIANTT
ncbi:uncharacterized protein LOC131149628 [Malania oleifera]|uniref:uncharacterized protein LOC131149628 n=1 Tax=Malania oleifera TaxID=397392 RepID=UPI0025AEC604|nr:uncharacterized protein LOC131149628 [Malania oleifera]